MIVYKITNKISGKEYVGQTTYSLSIRWSQHLNDSESDSERLLCKAIRKYGHKNFEMAQIDAASSIEELNKKEVKWIAKLNTFRFAGGTGYNMNMGGGSNSGYKHDPLEVVARINKIKKPIICINTGKIYTCAKEAAKEIGIGVSLIHNVVNGRKSTAKGLIFESLISEVKIKADKRKAERKAITDKRFTFGRPVICLNTGEEYSSIKEAARKVKVAENNMTFHLQGKQKTMKGLVFKYKDELVRGEE